MMMPKIVTVTPAQVSAAKLKVKRSARSGKAVSASVTLLANAKRRPVTPAGTRPLEEL